MRILLAGAGGQLGQDLAIELGAHELRAFRRDELDISDRRAVMAAAEQIHPAWIVNAAAYTDVDGAESAEKRAFDVNAKGPANLAEAGARVGARLLHISTDYVFNGKKGSAYTEDDLADPINVYGKSKRAGEISVMQSPVRSCILRTAWLYGLNGKNFARTIRAAALAGKPLRVVTDQVGSPTFTRDLALAVTEGIGADLEGLFHVVNEGACSRFEFAKAVVAGTAEVAPITTEEWPAPAARLANGSLRTVRWGEAGMSPLRSWQEALAEYLRG